MPVTIPLKHLKQLNLDETPPEITLQPELQPIYDVGVENRQISQHYSQIHLKIYIQLMI